jgi:hypothetical protein
MGKLRAAGALVIFTYLMFVLPVAVYAQDTILTTDHNCRVRFNWLKFENQSRLFYGTWDGTYTVFLFRKGETRDKFVVRETTIDDEIVIGGLVPRQAYQAEIFLTGAFHLPSKPYWYKHSWLTCSEGPLIETTTAKGGAAPSETPTTNSTAPETLPDTGIELGYFLLLGTGSILVGRRLKFFKRAVDTNSLFKLNLRP